MSSGAAGRYDVAKGRPGLAPLLACLLLVFGLVVAAGWAFDIEPLKQLVPGERKMPCATAVQALLLGCAVLLGATRVNALRIAGRLLALISGVAASAVFLESWFGFDWHTGETLFTIDESRGLSFPGPMSLAASAIFALLSFAYACSDLQFRKKWCPHELLAGLAATLSMVVLIGNACGVNRLCTPNSCVLTTFKEAVVYIAACATILTARPDRGLVAFACADTLSGKLLRFGSIILLLVPALLWLRQLGEGSLWEPALGWVLFGISLLIILAGLVANFARWTALSEKLAREKEMLLGESENRLAELSWQILQNKQAQEKRLKHVCLSCEREFGLDVQVCPHDGSKLARIAKRHYVGEIFANRYMLRDFLGEGGMSAVYKAEHISIRKVVAIKVIHNRFSSEPQSVKRLQQEARAAGALNHINLVGVYDFDISEEGEAYVVMEFLSGKSLAEILSTNKRLPEPRVVELFSQVCDGLEYAHKNGVIHRDLKPSNIMLVDENGSECVKIVDFGIAKDTTRDASQKLTTTGELIGSPPYMSPEQCAGDEPDARSDVYSLGCVLYECLIGHPPFRASNAIALINMHLDQRATFAADTDVSPEMQAVVLKCLEKDPAKRYQSVAELRSGLHAVQSRTSVAN
jgi:serine/threonine-protein kinase